ncbi:hypothetical protein GCM10011385_00030 [Nitratireductor aestuarii]|uniref:HTH cro/C1-type domain-containing protein n=1 Tax=Nitratireductor aestuarii TaxID=1735103 RepID=A0A916VXQ2_9HYPH|nr:helix-turn-helix transcriptional regulator [Nitratireductor aestuarii]GGA50788.1 hypothetical protein GCM10011385_00030 [Nitratireductor aestuarii]
MNFDDRPDFAKRLEQARKSRGFSTPKEAAERFGWVYETYIQHEQGIRGISRQSKKYADAFKVSEAWLLTGEGDSSRRVSSQDDILSLLKQIDGLAEQDIEIVLRIIMNSIRANAIEPEQSQPRDQSGSTTLPRAEKPLRQR